MHRDSVPAHHSFTSPFTARLRSLVRRLQGHVAKVVLFGSGLESLPFVRKLFWEQDSPYKPIGLYPGKDGTISLATSRNTLLILYSLSPLVCRCGQWSVYSTWLYTSQPSHSLHSHQSRESSSSSCWTTEN